MIKLQTYAALSIVATLGIIYHAFSTRRQFYPAMVYLSTSKISLVLLLNMGLVIMCVLWQLTKKIFLGTLREAEVERLNEQSWREVMEILLAITIFRQDFSVSFLAMITALLLIKALHWLSQKRVEYIETTPAIPRLSHARIVSFMAFLLLVDGFFFYSYVKFLMETKQASVALFFAFEYMILATSTIATFVKYGLFIGDMLMEGQWEKKAVYTFYLELIRDLLHLTMYMCFFFVIFVNYGIPLHLIRELYETFHNFRVRISDYVRYRKITSNMNDRFPDATPEELNSNDATCIICREEMTTAKKLICGHLFHVHCLRSWLERQTTCPTCRAPVVPPEHSTSTPAVGAESNEQGTAAAPGASSQDSIGDVALNHKTTPHEVRIQAAASAATIYEKSFVYPSPNKILRSPGYALVPCIFSQPSDAQTNVTSTELPLGSLISSDLLNPIGKLGPGSTSDSIRDLQIRLLHQQIELLQSHRQLLQASGSEVAVDRGTPEINGKAAIASSPPSMSNFSETIAHPTSSL